MGISRRPAKYGRPAAAKKREDKAADGNWRSEERRKGFVLAVVDGQNQGKEYFFETEATIGRVETNNIPLAEPGVSRNHARVRADHGVYVLEDLQSANGTRLNGEMVVEAEVLRDGDYITLAQTTMQFSVLDATRGDITGETRLGDSQARRVDNTDQRVRATGKSFLRSKKGKAIVIALLLIIGGSVAWKMVRKRVIRTIFDQSDVPMTYSDEDSFFNAVFGNGRWDATHVNQVLINFEYLGGRATLQYGAWGIDKVGEVAIMLNGEKVGQVPLTLRRWTYGLKLVLPRSKLKRGKNQLAFNNVRNPPGRDRWEVCYVQIIQVAIPPADEKEARHRFTLPKKAWEDREVEPSNMSNALVGFKKAQNYLEALTTRPELYQEVVDYIDKVDKALTRRFQEGLFSARRAEKLGKDPQKARLVLLRTMRFFRKDDFRYRELKRYLGALAKR